MKSYNFHLISLLAAVLFFSVVCPQKTHAALTKQLSYQGRLNNASGQPVANGTYSIVFSIYNVSSGGSALWTETQNVNVESGGFSAYLGSVTPLTLPFNEDYYLGIKVGSDPEMTPRLKLAIVGTSAFAFEAGKLEGKAASDFALSTHNHDSNYSASAHTHPATGVTQIVAGANVTISPADGTGVVTINAAGGGGGSSLTPASTVQPVTSASVVGTSLNYAREDHQHNIASNFITDSLVSSSAGIATSKLSGTVTAISGHGLGSLATLNAVGSAQITDGTITFTDIAQNGCASGQVVEWNGTAWNCGTDDVGGGGGVITSPTSTQTIIAGNSSTTPLALKAASAPTAAMFDVQDFSGGSVVKVAPSGNLLVGNPITTTPKVSVEQTGSAMAGYFKINNAANGNPAILGEIVNGGGNAVAGVTGGIGIAAYFEINNAGNSNSLISGDIISGTGNLLQLQQGGVDKVVVTNAGNALVGNPTYTSAKVSAEETGTANAAGYFKINNAASTEDALKGYSVGSGPGVSGQNDGSGNAGYFYINVGSNTSAPLVANTVGTGNLLQLQVSGVNKFVVDNTGAIAVGGAANMVKNNPSATQTILPTADVVPLILKDDAAATANLFDIQTNAGASLVKVSPLGNLLVGSPTTTTAKVSAYETGTANRAGYFEINNATSVFSAIEAFTNGTGDAIQGGTSGSANGISGYTTGNGNAVAGQVQGAGTGVAGNFSITNVSNGNTIIRGNTTGTGNLLQLQQNSVDKFVVDNAGNITVGGVSNVVKTNPSAAQTILPTADVVPLILKDDGAATADLFDIQNNGGASLVKVNPSGNLLVGNPTTTIAKVSAEETGTANIAGYFKINNATNTNPALSGQTTGTSYAGFFQTNNASNSASLILGNIQSGTGNLLQLQQGGIDKFIVSNTGNITTVNGGTNMVPLTDGISQQLILKGNSCEGLATDGFVTVTFTPAFSATPIVTFAQTGGTAPSPAAKITSTTAASFTVSGFETGGTPECVNWIAIGDK